MPTPVLFLILSLSISALFPTATPAQSPDAPPSWGRIHNTNATRLGQITLEIQKWPTNNLLQLPTPFPEITRADLTQGISTTPLTWSFNTDASQLNLELPPKPTRLNLPAFVQLETTTTNGTGQFPDGRIVFSASQATLSSKRAQLESHPGNHRIGFWTDASDSATWEYSPTRWGRYTLELTYSADGGDGTILGFDLAGQSLQLTRPSTGSWYRYRTAQIGTVDITQQKAFQLTAKCTQLLGAAAMNLKALTLRPAPEGAIPVPSDSGTITLPASSAITHSTTMRYEPATIKNCLGYWVNPADWAEWNFFVPESAVYDLQLLQGCGKGQGGSDVLVEIAGQEFPFVVEETGHFQIFLPRQLGRVFLRTGNHHLKIKPIRKKAGAIMDIRGASLTPIRPPASTLQPLQEFAQAKRVVFLGDSITYSGEYIELAEAYVRMTHPQLPIQWINIGLPSETTSGLSEPGHAGGSFPRPTVHERLDRILNQLHPDLVVACYGMNDGIYHPQSPERFDAFKKGIQLLHDKVTRTGAQIIHLTPPVFDPIPLKGGTLPAGQKEYKSPFHDYNQVLDDYSTWLVSQRAQGWKVIDIHNPMNQFLADQRKSNPGFLLAGDGVHANAQGHWIMARELLRYLGAPESLTAPPTSEGLTQLHPQGASILKAVQQRQRLLKDPWLFAVGHLRPGMGQGKPLPDALHEAALHEAQLHALTLSQFPGKQSLWFGFRRHDFEIAGHPVLVVSPMNTAPGNPWLWHGEFFGHKPNPDIALLGRGFHIVYMSVPDMLGSPKAVSLWNETYKTLTSQYHLSPKPALVGLSRGGLYCYNWAIANPNKVSCIYGDAPVCDFRSWPGGKGKGPGSTRDWQLVLKEYGFQSEADALAYTGNPVDSLTPLAQAKVPLLHVYGDADEVVPWDENTGVIADRYRKLGGHIELIAKPGVKHHPHGLDDSTPIVEFIWKNGTTPAAQSYSTIHGGGPLDSTERPLIRKLGTVDVDLVEATPIVFSNKVWRFEWVRHGAGQLYWDNKRQTNYFRFRDPDSDTVTPDFADGHEFGSAFVHNHTVYVTGTFGRNEIHLFESQDLQSWKQSTILPAGKYGIFNTSLCKTDDGFVLMFEIDKPEEEAGKAFTARFLTSSDLSTWKLTPPECNYAKDRYTAPHSLRWHDGWFYNFYLEAHQGYEMRVVRSRDLIQWQSSPLNPVLRSSARDRIIANSKINDAQRTRIANAVNLNNSDIDFCEFNGQLRISYSWGNQQGVEHLAAAVYDGSLAQFLKGWFPQD